MSISLTVFLLFKFYGISELANLCRIERESLKCGEIICWRSSAIPHYWRIFIKCIVDKTLTIPFTFERNAHFFAKCIACEEVAESKHNNTYVINYDDWSGLAHLMETMNGKIEKVKKIFVYIFLVVSTRVLK